MSLDAIQRAARAAAGDVIWGKGVELSRSGAVAGISDDDDGVHFHVKTRQRALPYDVWLWPSEPDWGCDCGAATKACMHVCAAVCALREAKNEGKSLPAPKKRFAVKLRYALRAIGDEIAVHREVVKPDGSVSRLDDLLRETDLVASTADGHIETLLVEAGGKALKADQVRHLLGLLVGADVTFDGEKVEVVPDPVEFPVRVSDEGTGFKVAMVRPPGVDRLLRGAARIGDQLRPTSHGKLDPEQRKRLVAGTVYPATEATWLVADYLPRLRKLVPVIVTTTRLPDPDALIPRVRVSMVERAHGLEIYPEVVYGEPPLAIIERGIFRVQGNALVARDESAERRVAREFEDRIGIQVGIRKVLTPEQAAEFLTQKAGKHEALVTTDISVDRFKVTEAPLVPRIQVDQVSGGFRLEAEFGHAGSKATADAVLEAWSRGSRLVRLTDGGFAELPGDWLRQHGTLLRELLRARDTTGRVDRAATAALVELLDGAEADVPPDLNRLRTFLEGGDGLPDAPVPPGFLAHLRPYQTAGYQWLRFLRSVELNGILADDMGLGKTLQAIAAIVDAGGRSLVIAPTSVLSAWQRELRTYAPDLPVTTFHGTGRVLDDRARIVLTSYTILRIDLDMLMSREWTYVVLDEAQAIKNPDSQTARAARKLKAAHRLCLSGTPVENRLEELWSLFHFLMPGLLGTKDGFRERYVNPIEAGNEQARAGLRARVRPYVLRRLKRQVAQDLPPLTDIVVRCDMEPAQRRIYDAVRIAGRQDVQRALDLGQVNTLQVLEALLRLRQACCDPALVPGVLETNAEISACKLDRLEELLVEIVCDDHKALIFSQWTSLLDRVEPRLRALGIPFLRLDGSTRDRASVVDQFQDPAGPPVFLVSLRAGGTGLTLTAADYVVHLDPWWNPAVQQQATDRAHRIGQDRPVVSYRLIAANTVEERILELQDAKRDLAEAAIGAEGGFVKALSSAELRSLFDAA
jgi:superfamily II DNA or RNA helicase